MRCCVAYDPSLYCRMLDLVNSLWFALTGPGTAGLSFPRHELLDPLTLPCSTTMPRMARVAILWMALSPMSCHPYFWGHIAALPQPVNGSSSQFTSSLIFITLETLIAFDIFVPELRCASAQGYQILLLFWGKCIPSSEF